jgi:hypothetical protein
MAKIHCARGPKRGPICKEYAKIQKYALLDIAPEKNPHAARPMIKIDHEGESFWVTFDVLAYFDTLDEAKAFAEEKKLIISKILNS